MTTTITVAATPLARLALARADDALILGHRLSEWCGHAPILEEDLSLANIALDLIGQARALLTHAGGLDGQGHDEDQLAFLRDERQYLNPVLMELPNGFEASHDFAFTQMRNFAVSTWLLLLYRRLQQSSDAGLAAIAAKAVKEAAYQQQHAADWVVRLGDGTPDSAARMQTALQQLWPYFKELFDADAVDAAAAAQGLGPAWSELLPEWQAHLAEVLSDAGLTMPKASAFMSSGKRGIHSEYMGHLLAELQYLQRAFPGGRW